MWIICKCTLSRTTQKRKQKRRRGRWKKKSVYSARVCVPGRPISVHRTVISLRTHNRNVYIYIHTYTRTRMLLLYASVFSLAASIYFTRLPRDELYKTLPCREKPFFFFLARFLHRPSSVRRSVGEADVTDSSSFFFRYFFRFFSFIFDSWLLIFL